MFLCIYFILLLSFCGCFTWFVNKGLLVIFSLFLLFSIQIFVFESPSPKPSSQLFSIILLQVPHMLEVQQNGIVLGTLVVDVWRVVCDCRELTNVFVFVCPQVDRALGIPHRRSNQLQIQNKVHLAHRGLVSRTTSQHFLSLPPPRT